MRGFKALREHARITWIARERGWVATPEDIMKVLSNEGFEECKRETTTSRRDRHPAGGVWQGVDTRTGSVASAVWVNHAAWPNAVVFIEVDGESLTCGLVQAASPEADLSERAEPNRRRPKERYARSSRAAMGKRARRGAGNVSRSLAREHSSDSTHAMTGTARIEAFDDGPWRQSGESDRGA